jgi:hypothetical protein
MCALHKIKSWSQACGFTLLCLGLLHVLPAKAQQATLKDMEAQRNGTQYSTKHHHYIVVDKGSLGGPDSVIYEIGVRYLNNQGTLTGCADTPNLDSNNPQNPDFLYPDFVVDPFIQHSFEWERGETIEDLGTLPSGSSSCTQWISDRGWIVGESTNGRLDPLADTQK